HGARRTWRPRRRRWTGRRRWNAHRQLRREAHRQRKELHAAVHGEGRPARAVARTAMRIVGGKYKGRDLTSPNDFRVRPTAEHVRGALLDALEAELKDARILDLFAGTGALGLEALSRGAKSADFVETRPASLHALKANVIALRMKE